MKNQEPKQLVRLRALYKRKNKARSRLGWPLLDADKEWVRRQNKALNKWALKNLL